MHLNNLFLMLAVAGILWNIITTISIHNQLLYSKILANMALMRYAPWIRLAEYKELTNIETGRTGSLYFHYVASILLTGISGAILVLLLLIG